MTYQNSRADYLRIWAVTPPIKDKRRPPTAIASRLTREEAEAMAEQLQADGIDCTVARV